MEIKQTYARLINSSERPALFLDVSANYGTHSALFLASGIATIAFEPNPGCFAYFRSVCELNGLNGRWEAVAIGNRGGEIELIYPEKETWLGSVASSAAAAMTASRSVIKQRVPMKRLDNFIGDMPRGKILVKIDVEGFEYEVIEGASQLIRDFRPTIIFESNTADKRSELFRLLSDHGCALRLLPWQPTSPVLSLDEFLTSAGTNFIAVAG
jgi:FkbM family methyltransferase